MQEKLFTKSQSSVYDLVVDWDGYRGVGRPSFNVKTIRINSYFPPIFCVKFLFFSYFLGGLSLHLNHLIAERVSAPYRQFGTLPIGIFLSNLVSGQLETSLMTSCCHF